jgi:hypothetical protein
MEKDNDQTRSISSLVQWATTRPQAYAVYFICLVLIGGLSFLAGTLNPKKGLSTIPPAVSQSPN